MSSATERAGQHLFIGLAGQELTPVSRRLLAEIRPAGVVLFGRNIVSVPQLCALTTALHALGILVAIDQEGGHVNRLRPVVGESPRDGRIIGRWLREFGVDINFAPVLDLALFDATTDNALHHRCWGKTPAEVIAGAGQFLDAMQAEGVDGCLKHFPGLGASTQDSHEHLPVIERSRERLLAEDIAPFAVLRPRAKAVMVGHGVYPAFDAKRPASLSRNIITGLLRRQLGFTGLVYTDDLEMGAISEALPFEQAVVEAWRAGADRLLVCHTAEKMLAAHAALRKAMR